MSVVIPAHNEEKIIFERLRNIVENGYPVEEIEIIVVDDASTDGTPEVVQKFFREYGVRGKLIPVEKRIGTNAAFNKGFEVAEGEIIVTTGADVFFEKGALEKVVKVLISSDELGAVCGDMHPIKAKGKTTKSTEVSEKLYRNFYGKFCEFESKLDSTFCFNGGLVAIKREFLPKLNEKKGADDASTAFSVIRKGLRTSYVTEAKVYEIIPEAVRSQSKQKIRRASRLIEAVWNNNILSLNRPVGRVIYPMRFYMFVVSPPLFLLSLLLFFISLFQLDLTLFSIILLAFSSLMIHGVLKGNPIFSFLIYQLYLFLGFLRFVMGGGHIWEKSI
jgi:cellulose synthase/poly-beta-1,6-N-acetylglucosamine synthase-like glycosyltransferase